MSKQSEEYRKFREIAERKSRELAERKVPGLDPVERFVLPPEDDSERELLAEAAEAFAEGGGAVILHNGQKITIPAEAARGIHMLLSRLANGRAAELEFMNSTVSSMFGAKYGGLNSIELDKLLDEGVIEFETSKYSAEVRLVKLVDLLAYRKAQMEEWEAENTRHIRELEALGIMQHEYDRLGLGDRD